MNARKLKRKVAWRGLQGQLRMQKMPRGYKLVHESWPLYLAAFKRWLASVKDELPVPLRIENRGKRHLMLSFANSRGHLEVGVHLGAIEMYARWQGAHFDTVVSLDLNMPIQDKRGNIVCRHCESEERPSYKCIEEFWEGEVFGRFLQWTNEHYAKAHWLSFHQGLGTWASLTVDGPDLSVNCLGSVALRGCHS